MEITADGQYKLAGGLQANFKIPLNKTVMSESQENILNSYELPQWILNGESRTHIVAPPVYNLKRKLDVKAPRSIKTARKEYILPYLSDTSLPKDLTCLFQPLYCKLCETHLNSNSNARLHYLSKNHDKKVKAFLLQYEKRTGIHHEYVSLCIKNQADDPKYAHCQTCDLKFTSRLHAEQHYMGRNHQKAALQHSSPAGSGHYDADGHFIRMQKTRPDTSGRFGIGQPFAEDAADANNPKLSKFFCELCEISTTSAEHLQMHYNGQKHKKKLKKTQESTVLQLSDCSANGQGPVEDRKSYSAYRTPSGGFYCQLCNVTLNAESQFVQHLQSRKHIRNKSSQNK